MCVCVCGHSKYRPNTIATQNMVSFSKDAEQPLSAAVSHKHLVASRTHCPARCPTVTCMRQFHPADTSCLPYSNSTLSPGGARVSGLASALLGYRA